MEKTKYMIMPERCGWSEVEAISHDDAFNQVSHWFGKKDKIAVLNEETKETLIFTRKDLEDGR